MMIESIASRRSGPPCTEAGSRNVNGWGSAFRTVISSVVPAGARSKGAGMSGGRPGSANAATASGGRRPLKSHRPGFGSGGAPRGPPSSLPPGPGVAVGGGGGDWEGGSRERRVRGRMEGGGRIKHQVSEPTADRQVGSALRPRLNATAAKRGPVSQIRAARDLSECRGRQLRYANGRRAFRAQRRDGI